MKEDSSKSTMLVITTGFLVLYAIFAWKWALVVSLSAGIIGIISSRLSEKVHWLWMKLSLLLSYIVPNILLSLVYYLFLFPIAILFRLFTKDPLMLSEKYSSYFININKKAEKESFEKTW